MQFTTSTNMNLIHDESLEELKKQICEPGPNPKRTLNLAAGIAKELYQIEAISPDEYQLLSRYLTRAMKSPGSPPKFPEFAPRAELHPVTISENEIAQIRRVVPLELRRDLKRCFRTEDIPFVEGLEGRVRALLSLGLISEDEGQLLLNSFTDKIASFTR